jgi:hypothetical protein
MSRNDPPEGTHVGGIFRDVAYWLGSIAPARPPDDHVPCLEDHRGRSTTCCSTLKAFLSDSPDTSQCDLGSWSLNSERDGPALPQRSSRERRFLFHDSSAVNGEMCRAGKMLATASR